MSFHVDPLDNTSINLTSEDLEEVPLEEILKYPQVLYIDLSINNIRALTLDFAPKLSFIVHLDLSKNCLEKLPPNFGKLQNLQHLDLYSNKISSLPVSMAKMTKLVWLDMKDNPINSCLKEVVGEFWNDEECKTAAKNIVFFMSQVRMFIKNVKDFEYQNVHSFTLKTNPFSILGNYPKDPQEPTMNTSVQYTPLDNNNPIVAPIAEECEKENETWGILLLPWLLRTLLFIVVIWCATILCTAIAYGPVTVESFFAKNGLWKPVDYIFIWNYKFIHYGLKYLSFSLPPIFPLFDDEIQSLHRCWLHSFKKFFSFW